MNYEQLKNKLQEKAVKQKGILGICFVLVFLIGFGSGKFQAQRKNSQPVQYINYTTSKQTSPILNKEGEAPTPPPKVLSASTTAPAAGAPCLIKGNISASGKKIFHVPGGASYKIVKPEQCFATEDEAKAAGFVKSSR